jgi:hypothetical protein
LPAKLLLVVASTVIFGSKSHGIHDHILLSDGSGSLPEELTAYYQSQSQLFYDWRVTANQFVLA